MATTKILITADLHYDIARSREPAERLAEEACRLGGDALVLVGDTAGAQLGPLRDCLRLFGGFPGRKLLVMRHVDTGGWVWPWVREALRDRTRDLRVARPIGFHASGNGQVPAAVPVIG